MPRPSRVWVLGDKEEIGSDGVDAHAVRRLLHIYGGPCARASGVPGWACFEKSFCLSADVTSAYDRTTATCYEKLNAAYLNLRRGPLQVHRGPGKSAPSRRCRAVAYVRRVSMTAGVAWQIAELGKVTPAAAGTVAMYICQTGISRDLDARRPGA